MDPGNTHQSIYKENLTMNQNRPRWLSFVVVFTILTIFWITLVAAISPRLLSEIAHSPVPGMFQPGNSTFGITIGAIVLLTIVLTSTLFRKWKGR